MRHRMVRGIVGGHGSRPPLQSGPRQPDKRPDSWDAPPVPSFLGHDRICTDMDVRPTAAPQPRSSLSFGELRGDCVRQCVERSRPSRSMRPFATRSATCGISFPDGAGLPPGSAGVRSRRSPHHAAPSGGYRSGWRRFSSAATYHAPRPRQSTRIPTLWATMRSRLLPQVVNRVCRVTAHLATGIVTPPTGMARVRGRMLDHHVVQMQDATR